MNLEEVAQLVIDKQKSKVMLQFPNSVIPAAHQTRQKLIDLTCGKSAAQFFLGVDKSSNKHKERVLRRSQDRFDNRGRSHRKVRHFMPVRRPEKHRNGLRIRPPGNSLRFEGMDFC